MPIERYSKENIELISLPGADPGDFSTESSRSKPLYDSDVGMVDEAFVRHIPGRIPTVAFLICFIEFSERLSYYLIMGCITNMVQRKLPLHSTTGAVVDNVGHSNESPGALGLGLPAATFLMQMMTMVANISPLVSGYYADTKFGKFKSLVIGTVVGIVGHVLLVFAALPPVLKVVPLSFTITTVSLLTVAVSAGFIKPNLMPLLMDQCSQDHDYVTVLDSGEEVIVDKQATLERITLIYYMFVNTGCFLALIGTFIERRYGFWAVFMITAVVYLSLPLLLWYLKPKLNIQKPSGESIFDEVIPLIKERFSGGWVARLRSGTFWDYVPIAPIVAGAVSVLDLRNTFQNCVIFVYSISFQVNDSALGPIQINQAGSMRTDGMPNDLFQSFNPLAIMVLIPFQDWILYPFLRRKGIPFTSVDKITVGFVLGGLGTLFGAYLQHQIYSTNKCGEYASTCDEVSPISAWWGGVMFSLQAFGECFANVTCYKLAYTRSPECMRSFVMALFLTSFSCSSFIGEILSWWAHDPNLTKIFLWCGALGLVFAALFYIQFRPLKQEELDHRD